jgi:uncharacterized protein with HEPN domain
MSRDEASVHDALTFAQQIVRITEGVSKDRFLADSTIHYAVLYLCSPYSVNQ